MRRRVHRNLDREMVLLGLKGGYILPVAILWAVTLLVLYLVSKAYRLTVVGFIVAAGACAAIYGGAFLLQMRYPPGTLPRVLSSRGAPFQIRVRTRSWKKPMTEPLKPSSKNGQ